ncbi:unnamed protein product, partial [Mesorhabditis spiculigera]
MEDADLSSTIPGGGPRMKTFVIQWILKAVAVANMLIFLTGLFLGVFRSDLLIVSLALSVLGLLGMIFFTICWIYKPRFLFNNFYWERKHKPETFCVEAKIDPEVTEDLMRNIRGIPFLIQAIQYSMETSYFRDIMGEMGEGIVRTSVIHTAPACTSVLDSETNTMNTNTPRSSFNHRHSAEEQWLENGENNWRNEQLRLSLQQQSSTNNLLVFPLYEASPQRTSMDQIENEFSRIESIRRAHGPKPKTATNPFQVRCIGMSANFIEQFNTVLQTSHDT